MILFHSSQLIIEEPKVTFGRRDSDFGEGFYLTKIGKQAFDWSKKRKAYKINVYKMSNKAIKNHNYKVFLEKDLEWAEFMMKCRSERIMDDERWDMMEGEMADSSSRFIVSVFRKLGYRIDNNLLDMIQFKYKTHQICISNQEVIDKELKYIYTIDAIKKFAKNMCKSNQLASTLYYNLGYFREYEIEDLIDKFNSIGWNGLEDLLEEPDNPTPNEESLNKLFHALKYNLTVNPNKLDWN